MSSYSDSGSQFGVAPTAPQPQAQAVLHPAFPRTALQLFGQIYPQFPVGEIRNQHTIILANSIPRRLPTVQMAFNIDRSQNISSYFMHATGELLSSEQACRRCQRGSGRYAGCVVVKIPMILESTGGACANCWYNRQGSSCTFRTGGIREGDRLPDLKPPVVKNVTRTADRTVYAAPKGTPISIPKIPANHITPDVIRHQAGGRLAASASPPVANALDTKVSSWESRYRKMSTARLVVVQEHLMEWQEDLNTRLIAMNTVFMARMNGPEVEGI
ncbi:hypothetical protein B0T26DRAFT_433140 [Lasiosphaeria miniovina]|uniref:Uncharacterized protein n=1 Tax=Lasiosphaeria miniovina TaxID=1954250 RepID=A0AA40DNV5_9PEZI|nr:uncharacterized protein B0T26DRAFT_433140 [Lasiosphaeria miniovina]KAK0710135.1 hypothetical protein B0T26DRAFT_433140 [Lasiosphaeria miniovina]